MRFAASVAMVDPTYYVPLARAAENAGFDAVTLSDSICYPRESSSKYPYTPDGNREFLENKPFVETIVAMAAMGAVTERLVLCPFVLKLPIRHPVLLAKEATSLAALTGNRVHLGVGTSPWPDDYEVVGLPWEGRGRRFEECIEVIRGLAAGGYYEHHGEFYDFPAIKLNPTPTEPIPMLIGGHSEINLARTARLGDGWMAATFLPDEELMAIIEGLHRGRQELGRTGDFQVYATTMDSFTPSGVAKLEEMGVTHTMGGFTSFNPYGAAADVETLQEKIDALNRYGDEVISKVR